jgi:hypothetical protein
MAKNKPEEKRLRQYVNPKQAAFLSAKQRVKTFIGGRGSGKTDTVGNHNVLKFNALPRAKSALAARTFYQVYTKTLPSMRAAWERMGFREYDPKTGFGHYIIGKRPPSNWPKPYHPVDDYSNCITWINGYTIEILSFHRPDSNRGPSYDAYDIDEVADFGVENLKILRPAVRGNTKPKERFNNHYLHQSMCHFGSAPWTQAGQWVYQVEELAKKEPSKYFFIEATSKDNEKVLGPNWLEDQLKDLTALEAYVELWNGRLKKIPNGFYPSFNENRHVTYDTFDYDYNESYAAKLMFISNESFLLKTQRLELSFDFNAGFTSMIVCQEVNTPSWPEFRINENIYVKPMEVDIEQYDSLIYALIDKFAELYKSHPIKECIIYGDRNGNNKSAGSNKTFYDQVRDGLAKHGWRSDSPILGLDSPHRLRYLLINKILSEKEARQPRIRINGNKCKQLIASIQNTPCNLDFSKNKKSESSSVIDQAEATHLGDTFDNIVYRKYQRILTGMAEHGTIMIGDWNG